MLSILLRAIFATRIFTFYSANVMDFKMMYRNEWGRRSLPLPVATLSGAEYIFVSKREMIRFGECAAAAAAPTNNDTTACSARANWKFLTFSADRSIREDRGSNKAHSSHQNSKRDSSPVEMVDAPGRPWRRSGGNHVLKIVELLERECLRVINFGLPFSFFFYIN